MVHRKDQINVTAEEERQLRILLSEAHRLITATAEKELKPLGITSAQTGVLYVLHMMKKKDISPTPAEIARWLSRRPMTISALLDRMEEQGLVTQKRDIRPREIHVEMTDKGKKTYREMREIRRAVPKVLSSLSPSQRQQMKAFLEKLTQEAQLALLEPPY